MANNFSIGIDLNTNNLTSGVNDAVKTINKLDTSVKDTNNSLSDMDKSVLSTIQQFKNSKREGAMLTKQITDLTMAYRSMSNEERQSAAGQQLKQKLDELKTKLAQTKDAVADIQQEISHLSSDTQLTDSVNAWTGVFGSLGSIMATTTGQTGEFQEVIMKLAKIQAITTAVQNLTKAFQKQNLVLLKNPYVAAAAAVVALGAAIIKLTDTTTPKIDALNREFENTKKEIERIDEACDFDVAIAEAAGKSVNEIRKIRYEALKMKRDLAMTAKDKAFNVMQEASDDSFSWITGSFSKAKESYQNAADELSKVEDEIRKFNNEGVIETYKSITKGVSNKGGGSGSSKAGSTNTYSPNIIFDTKQADEELSKYVDKTPLMFTPMKLKVGFDEKQTQEGLKALADEMQQWIDDTPVDLSGWIKIAKLNDLENLSVKFDAITSSVSNMASAFQGLTRFMDDDAAAWTNWALTSAQAISQAVGQIAQLIIAQQAQALAAGTAAGAGLPFPANLAAITAGVAAVMAIFTSLPAFSEGGIMGGTNTIGDYNLARVNKGEMLLNNSQQARLFKILNGNIGIDTTSTQNQNVEFRIKGRNLVGSMNNEIKSKAHRL